VELLIKVSIKKFRKRTFRLWDCLIKNFNCAKWTIDNSIFLVVLRFGNN